MVKMKIKWGCWWLLFGKGIYLYGYAFLRPKKYVPVYEIEELILHEYVHHLRWIDKGEKHAWYREYIELFIDNLEEYQSLMDAYWNHSEEVLARHMAQVLWLDWKANHKHFGIYQYLDYHLDNRG